MEETKNFKRLKLAVKIVLVYLAVMVFAVLPKYCGFTGCDERADDCYERSYDGARYAD